MIKPFASGSLRQARTAKNARKSRKNGAELGPSAWLPHDVRGGTAGGTDARTSVSGRR